MNSQDPLPRATAIRGAPPVDLDIRVTLGQTGGKDTLRYTLHSPGGNVDLFHKEIHGKAIVGSPKEFQESLLNRVEKLNAGLGPEGEFLTQEETASELVDVGRWLYRVLFPQELCAAYRKFRSAVKTLQITSDEPWIPWELVKPYDDSDPTEIIDDEFLCIRFQLTRWLPGGKPPAATIPVTRLAAVDGDPPLPSLAKERRLLTQLAADNPGIHDASLAAATFGQLKALLEEDIDLFHFVGHGTFSNELADESKIELADHSFRPQNLTGTAQTRLRLNRPLVFLNACEVARQGWAMIGLGGWAKTWVRNCACGAFIAPQWTVSDDQAYEFARCFYEAVQEGKTFGETAQETRRKLKAKQPGRPAWLAYCIYAHANGRLLLGQCRDTNAASEIADEPTVNKDLELPTPEILLPEHDNSGEKPPTPILPKTEVGPALASAWTLLGSLHLGFVGTMLLANRSIPVFPGLTEFLQEDVAAFFGIFFGLPTFYLTLYIAREYCHNVILPRPARELSIRRRIALRLPVALETRISDRTIYRISFLTLIVVIPMLLQSHLYLRLIESNIWNQSEGAIFSSSPKENLSKYVTLQEAFLSDNYRIGSIGYHSKEGTTIFNVRYFPFWEAWIFLFAELVALSGVLHLLWKLATAREPRQKSTLRESLDSHHLPDI